MLKSAILVLSLCLCAGCGLKEREANLAAREQALNLQKEALLARELDLQQREEALARRQKELDSTEIDTMMRYDPRLIGTWRVQMTCSETSCPGSAVGDTKSETWAFSYEGDNLVARAMVKNNVVRVYTGKSTADGILLGDAVANSGDGKGVAIAVTLAMKDAKTMEGQREISRGNECRIVYTLQLTKQ